VSARNEAKKKLNVRFIKIEAEIKVGDKVKMRQNIQVGILKEVKGKKAVLQIGIMPCP
jgi:DNA mismatch repair protein MutS2